MSLSFFSSPVLLRKNTSWAFALFLLAALLLAGCSDAVTPASQEIDPLFREFYNLRGGVEALGPALGPAFEQNGLRLQICANAVLQYDPAAAEGEKFGFAPVATAFVQADAPLEVPEQEGIRILNGHILYPDFVSLFDSMGGLRFVGNPLTEARVNTEQHRVEQYFERLGFYRSYVDPQAPVQLLPYGLISCHKQQGQAACQSSAATDAMPQNLPPEPFLPLIQRLGEGFAGKALTGVYLAEDGKLEQVYENILVAASPEALRQMELRPLPQLTGIPPQPPTSARAENGLSFVPVTQDGLGFNVATAFLEYTARHGSVSVSGQPITELFEINGLRRQCFEHYCLDFDSAAPSKAQIRLAPLGYEYLRQRNTLAPRLQLRTWEEKPYLPPGAPQTIGVSIYNGGPSQPLADLQPTLTVTRPDGQAQTQPFAPTSASGASYFTWTDTAQTGTYIYEVCATWPGAEAVCVRESWLVR